MTILNGIIKDYTLFNNLNIFIHQNPLKTLFNQSELLELYLTTPRFWKVSRMFLLSMKVEWSEKILNAQSMVEGYWVRFSVKNNLSTDKIGLDHNVNREKKIFTKNSSGVTEFKYWKWGFDKQVEDNHFGSSFRVIAIQNEVTTIYNFFRSKPFNRFMDTNNYHRIEIGTWQNLRIREISKLVIATGLFAPALLFGFYYFFVYLISGGNYIWLSLALLQISLIQLRFILMGTGTYLFHRGDLFLYFPLLFLCLTQFFRKSLFIDLNYPKINKIYILGMIFYGIVIISNVALLLNWPSESTN